VERGFDIVGFDCGFYRDGWLHNDHRPRPLTFTKDVRQTTAKDFQGIEAASLSKRRARPCTTRSSASVTTGLPHPRNREHCGQVFDGCVITFGQPSGDFGDELRDFSETPALMDLLGLTMSPNLSLTQSDQSVR
jgi:hypothetical protein